MKMIINNDFDVCIRLREIPDRNIEYNPEMQSSDDNQTVGEEEKEDDDRLVTIYYFEHGTRNILEKVDS